MDRVATVAEFHKNSSGKLTLWSLTAIERGHDRDGREYLSKKIYDVEYSRTYGYLFQQSGWGGAMPVTVSGIYFTSGDDVEIKETPCDLVDSRDKPPWRGKKTQVIRQRNRTRRLRKLPKAFTADPRGLQTGDDILNWLQNNGIEQDAVYCSDCRDFVPGDELCKHCWWCDKTGWYSTPAERCECKNRDECFGK